MIQIPLLHTIALSKILCKKNFCLGGEGESAIVRIAAPRRIYIYFLEIENLTVKNTQPWGEVGGFMGDRSCAIGVGTWWGKRRKGSASWPPAENFSYPLLYVYVHSPHACLVRGVLGNKCAGHHNLKTVKIREILFKWNIRRILFVHKSFWELIHGMSP